MRFRQAHRARPFAGDDLGQIKIFLFLCAVQIQRTVRPFRQAGIHAERHVGGADHFLQHAVDHMRHAHAAILRIGADTGPAAFAECFVGFFKTLGRAHDAVLVMATFGIAALVQREQNLLANLGPFLNHLIDDIRRGFLIPRQLRKLAGIEHFVQDETDIINRGFIGRHGGLLLFLVFPRHTIAQKS